MWGRARRRWRWRAGWARGGEVAEHGGGGAAGFDGVRGSSGQVLEMVEHLLAELGGAKGAEAGEPGGDGRGIGPEDEFAERGGGGG